MRGKHIIATREIDSYGGEHIVTGKPHRKYISTGESHSYGETLIHGQHIATGEPHSCDGNIYNYGGST